MEQPRDRSGQASGGAAEDPDAALLAAYAAGDAAAARRMAERFTPLAFRLALRMVGDRAEAEDLAQEAMIRLMRAAPGWRAGGARVTSWLYRVVANLCLDGQRRRPMVALDGVPEAEDGQPGVDALLTDRARVAALDRAFAALPERQRLAVVLRHIEGLANPEIALILDVGVEAVESLIARGLRGVKAALVGQRGALGYEEA